MRKYEGQERIKECTIVVHVGTNNGSYLISDDTDAAVTQYLIIPNFKIFLSLHISFRVKLI